MKTTFHVPTEQYGFLEHEVERIEDLTEDAIEIAVEAYNSLSRAVKGGLGLDSKEFDGFVQRQLCGTNTSEDYELMEKMSVDQRWFINCNKRAMNRINKN